MSGHIIHLDTYGNLISNLPQEDFQILSKDKSLLLRIGKFTVDTISESFDLTDGGDCIAFFNSLGLLQVTINLGKANELLGLGYGSPIQIEFFER
jgi:S-adenosylmethionine hydrolase